MSIIKKAQMDCKCGEKLNIDVVTMLNITTHPSYWPHIYSGELNSVVCQKCSVRMYWPGSFVFCDMERKILLNVLMAPLESGVYMLSHSSEFIKNFNDMEIIGNTPDLTDYEAATVMNLEDLKSKIHAKMAGLEIQDLQFIEYVLETRNNCDECGSMPMRFIYERSDKENHYFRTVCTDCARISMIAYQKENYNALLNQAKQRIKIIENSGSHVNAG